MNFSFSLSDFYVQAYDVQKHEEFFKFFNDFEKVQISQTAPKPQFIPMMAARRLSSGCKLAVDIGLRLTKEHDDIGAAIYSSKYGELEHNYKVIEAIDKNISCSPTDFSMSVHNSAVGNYTIISKNKIPSSSVTAGIDSFMNALVEAYIMLQNGLDKVLVVNFDGYIPPFYANLLDANEFASPFAVGLVLKKGSQIQISTSSDEIKSTKSTSITQSLVFIKEYLEKTTRYSIAGENYMWNVHLQDK